MPPPLADFLRALRSAELTISPAEAIDAHRAAVEVGWSDRILLRDALCVTLAKTSEEADRFDACFDAFFARDRGSLAGAEAEKFENVDLPLARMLLEADAGALAAAMEAAAGSVGVGEIRLQAQRNLLTRRMLDAMGLRALEALINSLGAAGGLREANLAERLAQGRAALFVDARRFVERQARLHTGATARRMREEILGRQSLTSVAPEDIQAMEALVRRMAKRLSTRYARRRHRARRGRLDVRRTVRRSMATGGVPFEIAWKSIKVERPRIIVLCDVSRSVAAAAGFLLLFLHSLNEVVERLDAFAFSDRLVAVNDVLDEETVDDAISLIMARIGFRPTDYGRALEDFLALSRQTLTRRTTVIILGDGRSNWAEPRLNLMREIVERSRAVVWLNPEPETYWGQGDSCMDAYRRFCSVATTCNSLEDLEHIVEKVLRTYPPH